MSTTLSNSEGVFSFLFFGGGVYSLLTTVSNLFLDLVNFEVGTLPESVQNEDPFKTFGCYARSPCCPIKRNVSHIDTTESIA